MLHISSTQFFLRKWPGGLFSHLHTRCAKKLGHRHEDLSHRDDSSERTQSVLSRGTHKVFYHLTMRSVSAVQSFDEQKECRRHSFRGNGPMGHFLIFTPNARKNSLQKGGYFLPHPMKNQ